MQALESKRYQLSLGPIADKVLASCAINTVFTGTHLSTTRAASSHAPNSLGAATDMAMMMDIIFRITPAHHFGWERSTDDGLD